MLRKIGIIILVGGVLVFGIGINLAYVEWIRGGC